MTPRMPRGLGPAGQKLYRDMVATFSFDDEPHKLRVLFDAAKTADTIARLDKEMETAPLTVLGSARQVAIHPCLAQAQTARNLLAQLLGRLGLPDTDEEQDRKAQKLSRTRAAAGKQRRANLRVIPRDGA